MCNSDSQRPRIVHGVSIFMRSLTFAALILGSFSCSSKNSLVDLLELSVPHRDAVMGDWKLESEQLLADDSAGARISFPYQPPKEYDFIVEFTLMKASGCTAQLLARGNTPFTWSMNAGVPPRCRIEDVDGHSVIGNPTLRKYSFEAGKRYVSTVRVRDNQVTCSINDQPIVEYSTDFGDLSRNPKWKIPDHRLLGIGSWNGPTIFHRIVVREINGEGFFREYGHHQPGLDAGFSPPAKGHLKNPG